MEHLGIKVKSMTEEEYCLIPMGGVLPKFPQRTLGIGGTGGMVHPSTGKALTLLFLPHDHRDVHQVDHSLQEPEVWHMAANDC